MDLHTRILLLHHYMIHSIRCHCLYMQKVFTILSAKQHILSFCSRLRMSREQHISDGHLILRPGEAHFSTHLQVICMFLPCAIKNKFLGTSVVNYERPQRYHVFYRSLSLAFRREHRAKLTTISTCTSYILNRCFVFRTTQKYSFSQI